MREVRNAQMAWEALGPMDKPQPARVRNLFRLRTLMLLVFVVAVGLAVARVDLSFLPETELFLLLAIGALTIAAIIAAVLRGERRFTRGWFGGLGVAVNVASAWKDVTALDMGGMLLIGLGALVGLSFVLGTGLAWALSATRRDAHPRRAPMLAWSLVIALAIGPTSMMLTHWPLRLAFRVSKPALERLADRVAGGSAVARPEWAGAFRIVGSDFDPYSGNVGLVTDPDPSGRSGLVRLSTQVAPNPFYGPFFNQNFDVRLSTLWHYQNED